MERKPPTFDRRIFWDVDYDKLDYDAKANFVIARVFERGDVEDVRNCRRYYGHERVREALLNAKFLMEHSMHLASAVVNEPLDRFRCYHLRKATGAVLPY